MKEMDGSEEENTFLSYHSKNNKYGPKRGLKACLKDYLMVTNRYLSG